MRAEGAEKKMTKRIEVAPAPAPLEAYMKHFDAVFGREQSARGMRAAMWKVCCCRANGTRRSPDWSIPSLSWGLKSHERKSCNGFSRSRTGMSARCKPSGSSCCVRMRPPRPTRVGCWSSMRQGTGRMVTRRLMWHVTIWEIWARSTTGSFPSAASGPTSRCITR
jgi:hypothetical protein